ncbi:MAG: NADH-quinone oxidoreductase subunit L [Rickettsiales bacterium]|jgi:NADH-quinone oxidoreductase subunit L
MLIKLILLLPLIGALTSGILSSTVSKKFAQIFNSSLLVLSAIFAFILFFQIGVKGEKETIILFDWITSGTFSTSWALQVDSLTSAMLVLVTFVSALVHIYSIGYMSEDKSVPRFMAYLSLFTFFMLILVTANNFLQLFVGWEGVGLASYLLIGFWFKKPSANAAAMKAFLVNRVGDFGLLVAIALIYVTFGSINFSEVFAAVPDHAGKGFMILGVEFNIITSIALLLFIGAMGKSAQIGLHTWLADAMEGPTPVSALIHAATMVTAGVFLVARCSPIFEYSPFALGVVTIVGALTAIFAATIALTQNDIKKIIAYSTCSQLGYMFFACGVSAYSAGVFHLLTHGFFKALLFLGAGAVIHAMHHQQDIRKMGGLWKKIPFTFAMMWIGSLALAGFPPFAGFYSKDAVLEAAFMSHSSFGMLAFYLGIIAAFLTAFYSWRLLFLVFNGKTRSDKKTFDHAHEAPKTMLIPLALLAVGAIASGFIGQNVLHMISFEGNFFENAIFTMPGNNILEEIHHTPILIKILPMILGIIAIALAYLLYIAKPHLPAKIAKMFKVPYKISLNKWYVDEIYDKIFVQSLKKISTNLWKFWDSKVIDGFGPNGFAVTCKVAAGRISKIQTGYIYHYVLAMSLGVVGALSWLIFKTLM